MEAADTKRQIRRQHGIDVQPVFCEHCRKFHLRCETWPPVRRWRDVLVCIARGFRRREIAKTLGMTDESVSWAIYQMCADWHALSQAHLITIVLSFGILSPDEFLLLDDELAKYRPRDSKKAIYSDGV
ncbi:MAG: hypothetical protein WCB99_14475 [Candidatus Cybelea sp.]